MLTLTDIWHAQARLRPYLAPTPLERAWELGKNVWLKLENTNLTHSFKIRGALNALLTLDEAARARGVVTASSGNHAQGVAYAAHLLGVSAQVLMPKHTPQAKVRGVTRFGAQAVLFGDTYDETEAEARRREREQGRAFVSPYNDRFVMAGAGTIGLELLTQLPDLARVVVCVGGGGLISGVGTAVKALNPNAEVWGVNAESAPAMYNLIHHAHKPEVWDTLAEALSGDIESGSLTRSIAPRVIDHMVCVSEAQIAVAMRWLLGAGWVVEGGGAVGVAAYLHALIPHDDAPTAIVVSGGNVDLATLQRVLSD